MKASLLHALHLTLALLIVIVLGDGYLRLDYSGANPHAFGLIRLQRDLTESRLTRGRAKIVQNVVSGTGDNNDRHRRNRGDFRT
jgi:cytochrome b561